VLALAFLDPVTTQTAAGGLSSFISQGRGSLVLSREREGRPLREGVASESRMGK